MDTWKAYVTGRVMVRDCLQVVVGRKLGGHGWQFVERIGARTEEPYSLGTVLRNVSEGEQADVVMEIDEGVAKALLDALAAYYGGGSDSRQLRSDYDNERGRADKLTDALIKVTERPTTIVVNAQETAEFR